MDVQVTLALIALGASTIALGTPVYVIWLNDRNAKAARAETYAREDLRDKKAKEEREEVARRVDATAARNASLIAESNAGAAARDQILGGKMDVLHTLGNSTLTASMQVALDGLRAQLILQERAEPRDEAAIAELKTKIAELALIIIERNKQAATADLQTQQNNAAAASKAVAAVSGVPVPTPPMVPMPNTMGPVTAATLAGEPPDAGPHTGALQGAIDSAKATVVAAESTVKAVDKK